MAKTKFVIELQLYQVSEFMSLLKEFGFDGVAEDVFKQYEYELLKGKEWVEKHKRFTDIKMNLDYKSAV